MFVCSDVGVCGYQACVLSLPACALPYLEKELDWDHEGVDKDLSEIADHMLEWEERLSTSMALTEVEISDIVMVKYHKRPVLQR